MAEALHRVRPKLQGKQRGHPATYASGGLALTIARIALSSRKPAETSQSRRGPLAREVLAHAVNACLPGGFLAKRPHAGASMICFALLAIGDASSSAVSVPSLPFASRTSAFVERLLHECSLIARSSTTGAQSSSRIPAQDPDEIAPLSNATRGGSSGPPADLPQADVRSLAVPIRLIRSKLDSFMASSASAPFLLSVLDQGLRIASQGVACPEAPPTMHH